MVMASLAAGSNPNESLDKAKLDVTPDTGGSELQPGGPRQAKRLQQADLSGFIGADLWMVGKYER